MDPWTEAWEQYLKLEMHDEPNPSTERIATLERMTFRLMAELLVAAHSIRIFYRALLDEGGTPMPTVDHIIGDCEAVIAESKAVLGCR